MLERQELAEAMQRAYVAVVPSIYDEMLELVAVEAFSSGLGVVAANVGGLGEIVSEAGITLRRGDARDLAAAFRQSGDTTSIEPKGARNCCAEVDYRKTAAVDHDLYGQLVKPASQRSCQ